MLAAPTHPKSCAAASRETIRSHSSAGVLWPRWFEGRFTFRKAGPARSGLTILGATLLPLVPLWGIAIRLAAFVMIHVRLRRICHCNRRAGLWLLFSAVLLSAVSLADLAARIRNYPIESLRTLLTSPEGLTTHWEAGIALGVADLCLVGLLASLAWRRGRTYVPRLRKTAIAALVLFSLWGVTASLAAAYRAAQTDHRPQGSIAAAFEQDLAASAAQQFWVLAALAALLHCGSGRRIHGLLNLIAVSGGIQAAIIVSQHLVGDYSYVIEAPAISNYFLRVKGTYYYHASADLFLLVAFFAALLCGARESRSRFWWALPALMLAALCLNSTRAISLAMVAGSLAYGGLLVGRRLSPWSLATAALVAGLFSTSILYEKGAGASDEGAADARSAAQEVAAPRDSLKSLAESNRPRLGLFISAAREIALAPLLGKGPGGVTIPLDGRSLGGSLITDSSHALLPDLAIGAGLPAAVLFVVLPGTALWLAIRRRLAEGAAAPHSRQAAALVGLIVAFAVASVFLPHELNYTIGVFLIVCAVGLAALWLPSPAQTGAASEGQNPRGYRLAPWRGLDRRVLWPLVATAIAWTIATSLSLSVPVLEFVALYARERSWPHSDTDPIYATSAPLAAVLTRVLPLAGCGGHEVRILPDDPNRLPPCQSWVLWQPAHDHRYPNLRKEFPFLELRPYAVAPAYRLPPTWQVMPSQQLLVSIIWVGPWASTVDPRGDLIGRDLPDEDSERPSPETSGDLGQVLSPHRWEEVPHPSAVRQAAASASGRAASFKRSADGQPRSAADVVLSTDWQQLRRVTLADGAEELSSGSARSVDGGPLPFDDSAAIGQLHPLLGEPTVVSAPAGSGCSHPGATTSQLVGYQIEWYQPLAQTITWHVELDTSTGQRIFLNDQQPAERGTTTTYRDLPREARVERIRVLLTSDVDPKKFTVRLSEGLLPNVAGHAAISERGPGQGTDSAPLVADGNHATAWTSRRTGAATLVFDLGAEGRVPLGMYGLSGVGFRDFEGANPTSWTLEASNDGRTWTELDRRTGVTLPTAAGEFRTFRTPTPIAYRYFRLELAADSYGRSGRLGLAEVRLFPRM